MTKVVLVDRRKLKKMEKNKNIFLIKAVEINYFIDHNVVKIKNNDERTISINRQVMKNIFKYFNLNFNEKTFCPDITYSSEYKGCNIFIIFGYIIFNSKKEYITWKLKNG